MPDTIVERNATPGEGDSLARAIIADRMTSEQAIHVRKGGWTWRGHRINEWTGIRVARGNFMDTMEPRHSKADLEREIEGAWSRLNDALDRLTPAQMTEVRDAEGWAVKDHLVHLAAWERSVVVFLQGRPRHEGLGVDEQLYLAGDDDAINAAIHEQRKDVSMSEAVADLREVHGQLLRLIEPIDDDDLYKPSSDFQPEAIGERDERPIIGLIHSNTANHFQEHLEWIDSLVTRKS